MTKRVKYTAIWKKSIKMVKGSKLSSFTTFPSSIFFIPFSTIIFAPHSWIPSSTIVIFSLNFFFIPSTTIFLIFSLLNGWRHWLELYAY